VKVGKGKALTISPVSGSSSVYLGILVEIDVVPAVGAERVADLRELIAVLRRRRGDDPGAF